MKWILRAFAVITATMFLIIGTVLVPSAVQCASSPSDGAGNLDAYRLPAPVPSEVRLSVIQTGHSSAPEAFTWACGSLFKTVTLNHAAMLIEHPKGTFLFDTGLGRNVEAQRQKDMAWWARMFFQYEAGVPARRQLDEAGVASPRLIVLSHAHWDHASGLEDFPDADVLIDYQEMAFIATHPQSVLQSQVSGTVHWKELNFTGPAYAGFPESFDLFGDGTAILVPLFGHTPGSVGMFLTAGSGKRYFLVGDAVWKAAALPEGRSKFWLASRIVDNDASETQRALDVMRTVRLANPGLQIVPAHDADAQAGLGVFPNWTR